LTAALPALQSIQSTSIHKDLWGYQSRRCTRGGPSRECSWKRWPRHSRTCKISPGLYWNWRS